MCKLSGTDNPLHSFSEILGFRSKGTSSPSLTKRERILNPSPEDLL